jgi:hypothetical protein
MKGSLLALLFGTYAKITTRCRILAVIQRSSLMNSITEHTCKISSLYNLNPPFPSKNCQNKYCMNVDSNLSEESETLNLLLNGTPLGIRSKQLWGIERERERERESSGNQHNCGSIHHVCFRAQCGWSLSLQQQSRRLILAHTHTDRNSGEGLKYETTRT